MQLRNTTLGHRIPAATVMVFSLCLAADARAACFTDAAGRPLQAAPALGRVQAAGATDAAALSQPAHTRKFDGVTGMWLTEFLLGDGPERFDQGFQLFHAGGTETMLSNGLPPSLGNVCLGVWDQAGRRIRLRHVAWNWDAEGHLTGSFVMLAAFRLDARGHRFEGTWTADSFDLSNNVIPELHAEGVVRGTRVPVD